jgi:hypothetical protein
MLFVPCADQVQGDGHPESETVMLMPSEQARVAGLRPGARVGAGFGFTPGNYGSNPNDAFDSQGRPDVTNGDTVNVHPNGSGEDLNNGQRWSHGFEHYLLHGFKPGKYVITTEGGDLHFHPLGASLPAASAQGKAIPIGATRGAPGHKEVYTSHGWVAMAPPQGTGAGAPSPANPIPIGAHRGPMGNKEVYTPQGWQPMPPPQGQGATSVRSLVGSAPHQLIPGMSTVNTLSGQLVWSGSGWTPNAPQSQYYAPPAQAIPFLPPPGYFAPGYSYPAGGLPPPVPLSPTAPLADPFAYAASLLQQPTGGGFDLTASQLVTGTRGKDRASVLRCGAHAVGRQGDHRAAGQGREPTRPRRHHPAGGQGVGP